VACILGVGVATLDIVNYTESYPAEDHKVRAVKQRITRGGNCANTLEVLSRLGHRCRWVGVLADEPDGRKITASFDRWGIDYSGARIVPSGKVPTSYITASLAGGSRTIVHYRDLPEFTREDFNDSSLEGVEWLHVEGRQVEETRAIVERARLRSPRITVSVEVEKPRPGIERLADVADVVFYSRFYATECGFGEAESFLRESGARGRVVFCTWGDRGAWVRETDGMVFHAPAYTPERVVDTIGAGDVFNAGAVDALARGLAPSVAVRSAVKLAGLKCGRSGLEESEEE
jgi:ketohexokinase